jgi:hypothetical protein
MPEEEVISEPSLPHELRTKLYRILVDRFNLEELRTLCFCVEIAYDNLGGEGIEAKVRELISYLERRGRIAELLRIVKQMRPDISWENIF